MCLTTADLTSVEERASNLSERLQGRYLPVSGAQRVSERRLARWKKHAAIDDPQTLVDLACPRRMRQTRTADLLDVLGPVRRASDLPAPAWTTLLSRISEATAQAFARPSGTIPGSQPLPRGGRIPFEHLYQPVCALAWAHVESQLPSVGASLGAAARVGLQRHLLRRIANVASPALYSAFRAHKAVHQSGMMNHFFGTVSVMDGTGEGSRLYASFVEEQGEDGMRSFFMRLPVAARLVAEVTLFWIEFVRELGQRLEDDHSELGRLFNNGQPLGQVRSIKTGNSDPHCRGRSVLILVFREGLRLVYKPRSLAVDQMFFSLVEKLNAEAKIFDLRVLKILDRGTYGWMEFVEHAPCEDLWATHKFYQRAGSLACLAHWLRGMDFHRENLVASGDQPVLIDLECLAHPLQPEKHSASNHGSCGLFSISVLRTGLLPLWQSRFGVRALYDNSGLGGSIVQRSLLPSPRWKHVNTDWMDFAVERRYHSPSRHRPRLNGRALSVRSFQRDVLLGYRRTAAILENTQNEKFLLGWRQVQSVVRRFIRRPTAIYGILLRQSLGTEHLTNGVDRSIELAALPVENANGDERAEEIASLEQLDIPYFRHTGEARCACSPRCTPQSMPGLISQEGSVRLSLRRQLWLNDGLICRLRTHPKNQPAHDQIGG